MLKSTYLGGCIRQFLIYVGNECGETSQADLSKREGKARGIYVRSGIGVCASSGLMNVRAGCCSRLPFNRGRPSSSACACGHRCERAYHWYSFDQSVYAPVCPSLSHIFSVTAV